MEKSKILKFLITIWILVLILFVIYTVSNEESYSEICYDGTAIDQDTGELIPMGGCETVLSNPTGLILLSIIWLIVFVGLFWLI